MNHSDILYKYRGIGNFKFFLDILVNNRLYASDFESMNDPREGVYSYAEGKITQILQEQIYNRKKKLNFCSLSRVPNIGPMWCHYADDYKGVVFGVKIKKRDKYNIRNIEYISEPMFVDEETDNLAMDILSKKLSGWEYEQEVRVFNERDNYIEVVIDEIIIGHKMEEEDKKLVKEIVKRINPSITITEIDKTYYK